MFASDLFKDFICQLEEQDLTYVISRNYESLPDDNISKDIDFVVKKRDYKKIKEVLFDSGRKCGYKLMWRTKNDYLCGFFFIKNEDNLISSVKIDLFKGFLARGLEYINEEEFFENITYFKGFKVSTKETQAVAMILYYILYAKMIPKKYIQEIIELSAFDYDKTDQFLAKSIGLKLSKQVIDLIKSKNLNSITLLSKKIRNAIFKRNIFTGYTKRFIMSVYNQKIKKRRGTGALIVFSGPDGAGKSTLIEPLVNEFFETGLTKKLVPDHLLSSKIPSLHKLPGAPSKYAKQDYTKPYQAKKANLISSILRTGYYFLAFFFDYHFVIKKKMSHGGIVIYDRYYTDMMTDPIRFRIGLNKKLFNFIYKFLPKPDLTYIILADKEKILQRKDELKEDKIDELLVSYSKVAESMPNGTIIYNNGDIDIEQMKLMNEVIDKLSQQVSKL